MPRSLFVYEPITGPYLHGYMLETQQRKFRTLQKELGDFIALHDSRRITEGFGEVGDSWLRAVRLMVGESSGQQVEVVWLSCYPLLWHP